jgi:hypothetical protein
MGIMGRGGMAVPMTGFVASALACAGLLLLTGCSAPSPPEPGAATTTAASSTTFRVLQCHYASPGRYAVEGCGETVTEFSSRSRLVWLPPANATGITITSWFPATTTNATLKVEIAPREGAVSNVSREMVVTEGTLDPDLTSYRVGSMVAFCDAWRLVLTVDEVALVDSRHEVRVHVSPDLEQAKSQGTASCNNYIGAWGVR